MRSQLNGIHSDECDDVRTSQWGNARAEGGRGSFFFSPVVAAPRRRLGQNVFTVHSSCDVTAAASWCHAAVCVLLCSFIYHKVRLQQQSHSHKYSSDVLFLVV